MDAPRSKPPCDFDDALSVLQRLRESGHVAYFAGGCVRDTLLGLAPKDYDIATDAAPEKVRKLFPSAQAVGAAFGVILVRAGRSVIEVATFRSDGTYSDGRRPDAVTFTTAEEDAKRRDFTINGLFLDPLENQVIDYVGGRDDLAARRLRAIGDPVRRFEEDHLRLLRAVRFAARFDLDIAPETADAIRRNAPKLKGVSPERIAEELRTMLTPPTRLRAWPLLWEFRLAHEIFRMLPMPAGTRFDPAPSVFLAICPAEPIRFGLALAGAVLDVRLQAEAKTDVRPLLAKSVIRKAVNAMRQALRISNDESDAMAGTLEGLAPLLAEQEPTVAAKKRFLARSTAGMSRKLMEAIAVLDLHRDRAVSLEGELKALEMGDYAPTPWLTGDNLTAAGVRPGPIFKRVLDEVYDAQLEGRVTTQEEALAMGVGMARAVAG